MRRFKLEQAQAIGEEGIPRNTYWVFMTYHHSMMDADLFSVMLSSVSSSLAQSSKPLA